MYLTPLRLIHRIDIVLSDGLDLILIHKDCESNIVSLFILNTPAVKPYLECLKSTQHELSNGSHISP